MRTLIRGYLRDRITLGCLVALATLLVSVNLAAQTEVKPGFNLFSVEQDVEIGRQSAAEAERQLPILNDRSVGQYVNRIGQRLARVAPGADYPYQFKVVNASDINAFALPGGFMYVNRGLIEAAQSEGELAGVMAHEMAHVALRHGTNQASKAYLAQAGLGVLGGLIGGSATGQAIGMIGGFGLNTLFLKFSRNAEEQADIVGTQMLAKAGYDPLDMASMFETLRNQAGRDPSKLEQFFSSHPSPANRSERIRQEAQMLSARPQRPVGGFESVQAKLNRMPPARPLQQIAQQQPQERGGPSSDSEISIEKASDRMRRFEQRNGFFRINYPENWHPRESANNGYGVTILPEGGAVSTRQGESILVYGVILNHYVPFDGHVGNGRGSRDYLEDATHDLVQQLLATNQHLRQTGRERRQRLDGENALSLILAGRSPVTGHEEKVTVFTRELSDGHVIYCLFVAPAEDYDELSRTFERMISSLQVNDRAAHR